jgi:hypothetical protein
MSRIFCVGSAVGSGVFIDHGTGLVVGDTSDNRLTRNDAREARVPVHMLAELVPSR